MTTKTKKALPVIRPESIHRQVGKPLIIGSAPRRALTMPTKDNPLIISSSELRSFLRCRTQWQWRYQDKYVGLERKPALALGTVYHEIVDQYYQLPFKRRTPKNMAKLAREIPLLMSADEPLDPEDMELVESMANGYAHWAPERDAEVGLVECFPEEEFFLPLNAEQTIWVRGKIDNRFISTTLKKTMAMLETKTASQFKENIIDTNLQLSVYLWALRTKFPGFKRYVAHYQQARKQLPGPRVKASLFISESVERSDEEIVQWATDTARAAMDMIDASIYASPMDSCSWGCDFKNACLLRGNPSDLKHIFANEYEVKPAYNDRPKKDYRVKV